MPKPQKKRESKAEKPKKRVSAFAAKIGRRKSIKGDMEEELDPTKAQRGSTVFLLGFKFWRVLNLLNDPI